MKEKLQGERVWKIGGELEGGKGLERRKGDWKKRAGWKLGSEIKGRDRGDVTKIGGDCMKNWWTRGKG